MDSARLLDEPRLGLTLNALKTMAVAAMVIDHIAVAFVPEGTALGILMHFVGRITGPVMFYAAVEGYHHTRDLNRYLGRLALFALVSWGPFLLFKYNTALQDMPLMRPNVIYTIFMGVLAVRIRRSGKLRNPVIKGLLMLGLLIACVPADWGCTGFLMIVAFDFFYGNFSRQAFAYCLIVLLDMGVLSLLTAPFFSLFYDHVFTLDGIDGYSLANLGAFLPILLLSGYRGQRGKTGWGSKWFFYCFYPLHLLVLGILERVL